MHYTRTAPLPRLRTAASLFLFAVSITMTADPVDAAVAPFTDIASSAFKADVEWAYREGITAGCAPTLYCPTLGVTREQMASFLVRMFNLPATSSDFFTDDGGSDHEGDINRVAAAGITRGCAAGRFCPTSPVAREQMASFIARAAELTDGAGNNYFYDDNGRSHEANIDRIAFAGIGTGCAQWRFCATTVVTRGQMAAFLHRIVSPVPAPPYPAPEPSSWVNVVNDQFSTGGVPAHWHLYDGPYASNTHNCAAPSHVTVSGGYMRMRMAFDQVGDCGPGWYTGGMQIDRSFGAIDQRVTVRFRVVGSGVTSHFIIPMRWPDTAPWPAGGEEDYCEGNAVSGCGTNLLYGSGNPSQVSHDYPIDVTEWHTLRFQRLDHVVTAWIDDMVVPAWTYIGNTTTLPASIKRVVLQQECRGAGCPSGTSGTEEIQIDWIRIDNRG